MQSKNAELVVMQGKKKYQEQLFLSFQLSDRVPENNFYRRLKGQLDLTYLYSETKEYYGDCGHKSIDPVVFMKLMLVGYLENLSGERKLIEHCSMRLDILYFLDYDIDEALPWHSTISRTRKLFPESVFIKAFEQVLELCVELGMVGGKVQAIDSAPVKANASMDSLELKRPMVSVSDYLEEVEKESQKENKTNQSQTNPDDDWTPKRRAKQDKSSVKDRKIEADERTLKQLTSRGKNWDENQERRPGAKDPRSKFTSNKTHYSPVDPEARISVKPGKARKLNYASQMAVDTQEHVITHIEADYADKKDNQSLLEMTDKLQWRLSRMGLTWKTMLADTGYSSGENYAYLEKKGIESFIPAHGTYKGGPENFTYMEQGDYWLCRNNKKVTFRKVREEKSRTQYGSGIILKRTYLTKRSDCKGCPLKTECLGKSHERKIDITYYNKEYDRAIARVESSKGQYYKKKRSSTVEPVFGTLTQHLGMGKVYARGIKNANKIMLIAGMAYNLKKYMKRMKKLTRNAASGIGIKPENRDILQNLIREAILSLSPELKSSKNLT